MKDEGSAGREHSSFILQPSSLRRALLLHLVQRQEATPMKAVVFHGIGDIRLDDVKEPKLKEKTDAIVRLTASAICGTDLHMIRGTLPGMKSGTILGDEGIAIV